MTKKQKTMLIRILIATAMLIGLSLAPISGLPRMALYMATYLIIGYDILRKAIKGIINGQIFDENFLMAVATVGAIALAIYEKSGDYNEAIAVMLFYQIGELFQSYAVGKSRRNISALMDIRPDYANIEKDGKLEKVDPDEVEIGSIIVVQPGEKVPLDGIITEGNSSLNTSALTGESLPMGAMGSDAAIEAADVVLMDDDPIKIAKAIRISRKCLGIVYQNIVFALVVKFACLILGALGIANMWFAIFADVGVMVLAILNAIRTLHVKNL